jgi:uncharacterized metal-binding protein
MNTVSTVKVIPCSGIGKVMGLLSRETALEVTGRLCPDLAETACLAHLVTGDAEAIAKVIGQKCIAIDGCTALCAEKSIEAAGGVISEKYNVVDELRNHRGKKPGDGSNLTEEGWMIVDSFAAKIAGKVRELHEG